MKEAFGRDVAHKETSHPDTAGRRASGCDLVGNGASGHNVACKETSYHDTARRGASGCDSVGNEASGCEVDGKESPDCAKDREMASDGTVDELLS